MTRSIIALTAAAFVAFPLMAANAAQDTATGYQTAQASGASKCAQLKDAKERAACMKKERGG